MVNSGLNKLSMKDLLHSMEILQLTQYTVTSKIMVQEVTAQLTTQLLSMLLSLLEIVVVMDVTLLPLYQLLSTSHQALTLYQLLSSNIITRNSLEMLSTSQLFWPPSISKESQSLILTHTTTLETTGSPIRTISTVLLETSRLISVKSKALQLVSIGKLLRLRLLQILSSTWALMAEIIKVFSWKMDLVVLCLT
jgi:hypothetical protein